MTLAQIIMLIGVIIIAICVGNLYSGSIGFLIIGGFIFLFGIKLSLAP